MHTNGYNWQIGDGQVAVVSCPHVTLEWLFHISVREVSGSNMVEYQMEA